ncbi:hypothetical protein RC52_05885 [Herbaspirillum rubrisubalbicans]|nr:hypothetical protein [Herbaspirillum rubrisubalbicans]
MPSMVCRSIFDHPDRVRERSELRPLEACQLFTQAHYGAGLFAAWSACVELVALANGLQVFGDNATRWKEMATPAIYVEDREKIPVRWLFGRDGTLDADEVAANGAGDGQQDK